MFLVIVLSKIIVNVELNNSFKYINPKKEKIIYRGRDQSQSANIEQLEISAINYCGKIILMKDRSGKIAIFTDRP